MRLALAEIRRAKLRFGLLIGAVALLVFLILFQQTLAGALLGSFTDGLGKQSAEVLVFNADARGSVEGSVIARSRAWPRPSRSASRPSRSTSATAR